MTYFETYCASSRGMRPVMNPLTEAALLLLERLLDAHETAETLDFDNLTSVGTLDEALTVDVIVELSNRGLLEMVIQGAGLTTYRITAQGIRTVTGISASS